MAPDGRGIAQSYAEADPLHAGYFNRPASSLIQMLLSTRARRRMIRSQMRTEREAQALRAGASEHVERLNRRAASAGGGSVGRGPGRPASRTPWLDNVNQTLVLPDGSVRVRA